MKFHFDWVIFRFHVSFRGCRPGKCSICLTNPYRHPVIHPGVWYCRQVYFFEIFEGPKSKYRTSAGVWMSRECLSNGSKAQTGFVLKTFGDSWTQARLTRSLLAIVQSFTGVSGQSFEWSLRILFDLFVYLGCLEFHAKYLSLYIYHIITYYLQLIQSRLRHVSGVVKVALNLSVGWNRHRSFSTLLACGKII